MIRIENPDGWTLIEHRDHARLAGRMATHWGNSEFHPPEPRAEILAAVARHDDAWVERDAKPFLTREGRPSAFSWELVGAYNAFEEMDLADYLAVRGRAAETIASANPYAAVIVSMHTIDLVTRRVDLTKFSAADRQIHRSFVEQQGQRQAEWTASLGNQPESAAAAAPFRLQRAFEFLQACDSLSLTVCVRYPRAIKLRHTHPRTDGTTVAIDCVPLGNDTYRLTPYPFDENALHLEVPSRSVVGQSFSDERTYREAFAAAPLQPLKVTIVR